jgi:hypothetical protein
MAKAPKAPRQNGTSDVETVIARVESAAPTMGDAYWRGHVLIQAVGPIARIAGEARARALLPWLGGYEPAYAQALANLAAGLARRGDAAAARAALAEATPVIERLDGELGTLAWCAAARARHALGDADACDAALAAAEDCARREKANPTQPWPHLALARADTGRLDALLAQLRALPPTEHISFDLAKAAQRAVAQTVAAGDIEAFARFADRLGAYNGHVLTAGLWDGVAGALGAGRGDALARIVERIAQGRAHYTGDTGAEVARRVAIAGDVPLARRIAELTRDGIPHPSRTLANLFADLGDAGESERLHAQCAGARAPHPDTSLDGLAPVYRATLVRDPEAARAMLTAHESAAQAAQGVEQALRLGAVGLALVATGESGWGEALLTQAATVILATPKSVGYTRGDAVKHLGGRAADAGCWSPAMTLLRKSTSKYEKQVIARPLARCYARAGDFAGALAVIAMGDFDPLHAAMAWTDLIAEAAGDERPYSSYG